MKQQQKISPVQQPLTTWAISDHVRRMDLYEKFSKKHRVLSLGATGHLGGGDVLGAGQAQRDLRERVRREGYHARGGDVGASAIGVPEASWGAGVLARSLQHRLVVAVCAFPPCTSEGVRAESALACARVAGLPSLCMYITCLAAWSGTATYITCVRPAARIHIPYRRHPMELLLGRRSACLGHACKVSPAALRGGAAQGHSTPSMLALKEQHCRGMPLTCPGPGLGRLVRPADHLHPEFAVRGSFLEGAQPHVLEAHVLLGHPGRREAHELAHPAGNVPLPARPKGRAAAQTWTGKQCTVELK